METISSHNVVVRFSRLDETGIMLRSEQGVWQISAELLQKTCDTVHVMEEVFGVTEIEIPGVRIYITSVSTTSAIMSGSNAPVSNPFFSFWICVAEPDNL